MFYRLGKKNQKDSKGMAPPAPLVNQKVNVSLGHSLLCIHELKSVVRD